MANFKFQVGEDTVEGVDGQVFVNGIPYAPKDLQPSLESQTMDGLTSKIWEELDSLFDEHSTKTGRNPICYQSAIEYLAGVVDADVIKLTILKNTSDLGILPKELKSTYPSLEDVLFVKPGSEDYNTYLSDENLFFNPITDTPTNELVQDPKTNKFNASFLLKTKGDLGEVAVLELYGIPSNDPKINVAIQTFNKAVDTKIHADLTNYENVLRIIALYQEKERQLVNAVREETGAEIVSEGGDSKSVIVKPAQKSVITEQKGFYYREGSFFDKNRIAFEKLLEDLRATAQFNFLLPDIREYYNNRESKEFITEVELAEKLAKLNFAVTYFEVGGDKALKENLRPEDIIREFENNQELRDIAMANALIGMYSLLPKRLTINGKPEFSPLQDNFSKLKISKALNTLWFDRVTNKRLHFIYETDKDAMVGKFYANTPEGKKEIPKPYWPILLHLQKILPLINDSAEQGATKCNFSANMRECLDIYMGMTQRTPYQIIIPKFQREVNEPHTVFEGLKQLNTLGYKEEAKRLACAVYYPYPFKARNSLK
ncbi:hypothetical protein J4427_02910 [Candidatus Woesearchaeota archaeon]|nr:hypothetical protein [Candidatus Woesearchaeota archaeon]